MAVDIKICGLSTPDTIEAALDAGADMVGLVFFPGSPRYVDPTRAGMLAARARGRAKVVALVVDADDALLTQLIGEVSPDLLQLHGSETPERVRFIQDHFKHPAMKVIGVSDAADIAKAREYVGIARQLMLDAKPPKTPGALPGGNGLAFDWHLVSALDPPLVFMLSGGLDPLNVADAIRRVRPAGVDVSSGVESAPGVKDIAKIRAFIAAARQAESEVSSDTASPQHVSRRA